MHLGEATESDGNRALDSVGLAGHAMESDIWLLRRVAWGQGWGAAWGPQRGREAQRRKRSSRGVEVSTHGANGEAQLEKRPRRTEGATYQLTSGGSLSAMLPTAVSSSVSWGSQ